ncbi:protein phosphatase 2C domain-containing protein [Streptomyces sp. NPDC101393]|uniref:protein phosphatase 2C domain-containing protein n=1 Tax=Streptomyces sp. NPDC101393 TaxID=3366141 RepID=UPI00382CEEA1
MNQQGARRGQEDDWWRQLYGDADGEGAEGGRAGGGRAGGGRAARGPARDTGPSTAPDSLDDRVNSALRAVGPVGPAAEERRAVAEAEPPAPEPPQDPAEPEGAAAVPTPRDATREPPPRAADFLGDRPPAYAPEPVALPAADPAALDELVPDTVLDGAEYGSLTLRAASVRGDAARYRGEPRRDALLTARFGTGRDTLILVALASGGPGTEGAHCAARDACAWIGGAVGRSSTRLAEDIRTDHRGALKSGLQRLTDRSYGKLRGRAAERGAAPEEYTAALRCLLLPADPECRTRVFFGAGDGGIFRLRDGAWQDLEPAGGECVTAGAVRGPEAVDDPADAYRRTLDLGLPARQPLPDTASADGGARPDSFHFGAATARPGDTLLLCSAGFAEPLNEEPAFAARLADRWPGPGAPGLLGFLADTQLRVQGHAKDRTAVGVWES